MQPARRSLRAAFRPLATSLARTLALSLTAFPILPNAAQAQIPSQTRTQTHAQTQAAPPSTPAHTDPPAAAAALTAQLQAIAAQHHGQVALFAENLRTRQTVALSPDLPVQTASVIKLAILYEALQQIRAGQAHFEDRLTLRPADQVPGSGVLRLLDPPLPLTLKDALTLMIVLSDNSATNLAIDRLGLENINARLAQLGLEDTVLYKKVFTPVAPGTILPPDQKKFGLGKTTAREMTRLMARLALCELAEPGAQALPGDAALCQTALKMLRLQFYRSSIPRYLDLLPGAASDSIANKTGSLDAVRNDIAAISTPNGLIILSIFTFNNQDQTWGADQQAELTIARLARCLLQAWSPQGLAPWPATAAAQPAPPPD